MHGLDVVLDHGRNVIQTTKMFNNLLADNVVYSSLSKVDVLERIIMCYKVAIFPIGRRVLFRDDCNL